MRSEGRVVAVTGADGFIGRNLVVRLEELGFQVRPITPATAAEGLGSAEIVFHLEGAGASAATVVRHIADGGRRPLVIVGAASEGAFLQLAAQGMATVAIYRLPEVFGKWASPAPASIVSTFCRELSQGRPLSIDDASVPLSLLYVDDLIEQWTSLIGRPPAASGIQEAAGVHQTTVGEVAAILSAFAEGRRRGEIENVGSGLERALYATYVAALPTEAFSYPLTVHTDPRGSFAEVIKTRDGGQVSVLTAEPGAVRGGHYHHSKVEKFLVVHGQARFRFRHILSGETYELTTSAAEAVVVETIPGWTHDITNVGSGVMVSLLWASEVFDRERPDTVMAPL